MWFMNHCILMHLLLIFLDFLSLFSVWIPLCEGTYNDMFVHSHSFRYLGLSLRCQESLQTCCVVLPTYWIYSIVQPWPGNPASDWWGSAVVNLSSCLSDTWSNAGTDCSSQDASVSSPRGLLLSNKLQRCSLNLHLDAWVHGATDRSTDLCSVQRLVQTAAGNGFISLKIKKSVCFKSNVLWINHI